MTAIGVCATAYTQKGERYDSVHTPPEVTNYIESVTPGPIKWADGGKFLEVDTSTTGQVVTAKAQIALGARGTRGEVREFSYWVILDHPNGRIRRVPNRVLEIHQGEFGLVGLVFGVERPRIEWYPMPQLGAVERWPDLFRHLRDQLGPGPDPGPALVITPRASEP